MPSRPPLSAHEIALARASSALLSIFPATQGTKPCRIPAGGVRAKPLHGSCTTRVQREDSHEPAFVVTFTERWSGPPCRPGTECALIRSFHHTWRVIEGEPVVTATSRPRVLATRQSGATAPQLWK